MLKIGYQGIPGAYSEIAAIQYFGYDTEKVPYDNFRDMIKDVHDSKIDYAMLPIENSTTGAITRALDLVKDYDVYMIGEEFVRVNHCLITFNETSFEDIRTIYSHPEALKQCDNFFDDHKEINKVAYLDTAKSVEYIIELKDKTAGALASKRAAEIYDMKILMEDMQDNKNNITRFGVITSKEEYVKDANVVGIYIVTAHESGSLFEALKVISDFKVNMHKIESRPILDKPFNYGFYIDFDGNLNESSTNELIKLLEEKSIYLKIMGNYKKNERFFNL
jgi:chorismate mutase/prephenate dehydratase